MRYPIRVVLVDNNFKTRFDRLVQLPKESTTYIYRVLDHGIPWQHLEAGEYFKTSKRQVVCVEGQGQYDLIMSTQLYYFFLGLTLQQVREGILAICRGKEMVLYDKWKTIGLFHFSEKELEEVTICDLKTSRCAK